MANTKKSKKSYTPSEVAALIIKFTQPIEKKLAKLAEKVGDDNDESQAYYEGKRLVKNARIKTCFALWDSED